MDTSTHNIAGLFQQLGLPSGAEDISAFISQHRPLSSSTHIQQAPFWTQNQSEFIQEAIALDSDWAPVVDELNALLHGDGIK